MVTWMSANSLRGICWPPGRRHRDIADLVGIVAVALLQANDEIELLFLLHHLGGDIAANRRGDQVIDVIDIQAIAGDGRPG